MKIRLKKVSIALIALLLVFVMVGCGSETEEKVEGLAIGDKIEAIEMSVDGYQETDRWFLGISNEYARYFNVQFTDEQEVPPNIKKVRVSGEIVGIENDTRFMLKSSSVEILETKTEVPPVKTTSLSKDELKSKIEKLIPANYKGKAYSLDILTSNDDGKHIPYIQLDSPEFSEESNCINVVQEILKGTIESDSSEYIEYIGFSFIADYKVTFTYRQENIETLSKESDFSQIILQKM